ncbi:MAG: hypothetical protein Ct9H300mP1_30680 [Planctomycetaceae bacterium]|nr:MAG: hypothetical protein Ct9H300mP1_30680 [Planctomycetaceae bacterium]
MTRAAWKNLQAENQRYVRGLQAANRRVNPRRLLNHRFLGGTFGPVYNSRHWRPDTIGTISDDLLTA